MGAPMEGLTLEEARPFLHWYKRRDLACGPYANLLDVMGPGTDGRSLQIASKFTVEPDYK